MGVRHDRAARPAGGHLVPGLGQTHAPAWTQARRAPGARKDDPDRVWRTCQAPAPTDCPAPSAPRILEIFHDIQRHQLIDNDGQTVQTFQPELTDLQQQVLDLLHIPASVYSSTDAS